MKDTYTHHGYTFQETEHPNTPKEHKAFNLTTPGGKQDIVFAKDEDAMGKHIEKLHLIAQKMKKSEVPRDGRSFNKLKKTED